MELHTFFFTDLHHHGDSFTSYLALRKRLFVDQLGWSLAHDGIHEMDQYDHPHAAYSIVTRNGKAVAGGRALSCSADWMGWTYMLNDAHQEKLNFIPGNLMEHYPTDRGTWECTRLVVDDTSLTACDRSVALKAVVFGLCQIASQYGGEWLLSLSPVTFGRLLKSIGYAARSCGTRYIGVEDRKPYRPFRMPCDPRVNKQLCAPMVAGGVNSSSDLLDRLLEPVA